MNTSLRRAIARSPFGLARRVASPRSAIAPAVACCVLVGTSIAWAAFAPPVKMSNAGDSISQGFGANGMPWDHPNRSWAQGSGGYVGSMYERWGWWYASGFAQQPESVTGAEMVGGSDSFPAQAARICAQSPRPNRVEVLLGGNDVCNRAASGSGDATENLYSTETWRGAIQAGLDQLAECLPEGSVVQLLSMPRVDWLYEAGHDKSWWCHGVIWPAANVCRIVTAEGDPGRRDQLGAAIDSYNDVIRDETQAYDTNANGRNSRGVRFSTDWKGSMAQGHWRDSVGTYVFGSGDINGVDCFHPNTGGQAKLACAAWASHPDGWGSVADCLD